MQLNAFSTQVESRVDNVSQKARDETAVKLMKRVRNLMWVYTHRYCAFILIMITFIVRPTSGVIYKWNRTT